VRLGRDSLPQSARHGGRWLQGCSTLPRIVEWMVSPAGCPHREM
jgi:Rhodanese-related sulfurtransferase